MTLLKNILVFSLSFFISSGAFAQDSRSTAKLLTPTEQKAMIKQAESKQFKEKVLALEKVFTTKKKADIKAVKYMVEQAMLGEIQNYQLKANPDKKERKLKSTSSPWHTNEAASANTYISKQEKLYQQFKSIKETDARTLNILDHLMLQFQQNMENKVNEGSK